VIKQRDSDQLRFLVWDKVLPRASLKIQAASPDGLRERSTGDHEPHFFELRPPPAHHMAAIASAIPHILDPSAGPKAKLDYSVTYPLCKMFAGNMRQITRTLRAAFLTTAGKAQHGRQARKATRMALDASAISNYNKFVDLLSARMIHREEDSLHQDLAHAVVQTAAGSRAMSQALTDLYARLMNASLVVRRDAKSPNGATDLIGTVACAVQVDAVRKIFKTPLAGTNFSKLKRLERSLLAVDTENGNLFESQLECRLFLRTLCEYIIPLSNLADGVTLYTSEPSRLSGNVGTKVLDTPMRNMLWSHTPDGQKEPPSVCLVRCSVPSKVDSNVMIAIKACLEGDPGNTTVIRTADNAPFCDFVVLLKTTQGAAVLLVEATISTLMKHSTGKSAPDVESPAPGRRSQKRGSKRGSKRRSNHRCPTSASNKKKRYEGSADTGGSAAAGQDDTGGSAAAGQDDTEGGTTTGQDLLSECPASLRDIVSLTFRPMYTVENPIEPRFKKATAASDPRETFSVGNAWLHVLNAPFRLATCKFNPVEGEDAQYHITKEALGGREEESKNWDLGILYVSGKHLGKQRTKGLSQLVCDFAYCACSKHLDIAAAEPVSQDNSPKRP